MIQQSTRNRSEVPTDLRLLDMKDVMAILGIKSDVTMYKIMDEKRLLPYRKIGKKRKFKHEDIKKYLDNCLISP